MGLTCFKEMNLWNLVENGKGHAMQGMIKFFFIECYINKGYKNFKTIF